MPETEETGSETFAEDTALVDLFGNHPKTKILVSLLSEQQDTNITHLADLAGIHRSTVYEHIDDLLKIGVVEQTREVGGSPMYQINKDNIVARKLGFLEWKLLDEEVKEDYT